MTTPTLPPPTTTAPSRVTPSSGARITGMACRNCGRSQALELAYVCPACFGPLEVAYDLSVVAQTLTKEAIAARAPGIWRYLELLPVEAVPVRSLPVGSTPLLAADRLGPVLEVERLWLKDDTRNPSLSFKDRAVAVAAARAVAFGVPALACASTGNLAGATAAAAAAVGLPAYVFIPADLERDRLAALGVERAEVDVDEGPALVVGDLEAEAIDVVVGPVDATGPTTTSGDRQPSDSAISYASVFDPSA